MTSVGRREVAAKHEERDVKSGRERVNAVVLNLQSEISDLNSQLIAKDKAILQTEKKLTEQRHLESKLEKSQTKIELLQKEIAELKRQNSEKNAQIDRLKSKDNQTNLSHEAEIRQLTQTIAELRQRNTESEQERSEHEARNRALETECIALEKKNRKLKKKLKLASVTFNSLNQQNTQLNTEKTQLEITLQTAGEDAKTLKIENDALRLKLEQTDGQIDAVSLTQQQAAASLDKLQKQLDTQQREISELVEERGRLAETVQKLHSLLCLSEARLQEMETENAELKKRKPRPQFERIDIEIEQLKIPFEEPLHSKVSQILSMTQYQPIQRFQIVMNEIQTAFTNLKNQYEASSQPSECESCKKLEAEEAKLRNILTSITRGICSLILREKELDSFAFCESDHMLLGFIAEHFHDFEPAINGDYIPLDLFSSSTPEARRSFLEKMRDSDREMFSLFNLLFFINSKLTDHISQMKASLLQKEKIEKWIEDAGVKEMDDIPILIGKLIRGMTRLKKQEKKLSSELCDAQTEQDILNDKIVQLENEILVLKRENETLKTDLQINANECALYNKSESSTSVVSNGRVGELESMLQSKTSEVEELKAVSGTMKEQLSRMTLQYQKWIMLEAQLKAKNKELADEMKSAEQRSCHVIQKLRKKNKKLTAKLEACQASERANLSRQQSMFDASTTALNTKLEQLREMSKKLADSLAASEMKNQQLSSANSEMKIRQEEYAFRVEQLNQRLLAQQRKANDMATAAMIEAETRMKNEFDCARKRLLEQSEETRRMFLRTVGSHYGVDDSDLSDDLFQRLLCRVKSDLTRV